MNEFEGHIGIVDFDGAGIAAGTFSVNRAYDGFIKAGCVYRKYEEFLDGTSGFNKYLGANPND